MTLEDDVVKAVGDDTGLKEMIKEATEYWRVFSDNRPVQTKLNWKQKKVYSSLEEQRAREELDAKLIAEWKAKHEGI